MKNEISESKKQILKNEFENNFIELINEFEEENQIEMNIEMTIINIKKRMWNKWL